MQGLHTYQPKPFQYIDIEALIPQNHILRKIDKLLDLSFVRELTAQYYCRNNGRPSIDPELFFRIILIGYIFGIRHDRRLCEEIGYNLAYRWYCKLSFEDSIPDHSTLSKIRDRYGLTVFESFFDKVIGLCRESGLVKGERVITDSILIEADASLDSMVIKKASEPVLPSGEDDNAQSVFNKKLSNQTHISTTDSDSSLAKKPGSNKGLKYKVHTSIDADSRVILDNKVTTGSCHDTQIYLERLKYIQNKYNLLIKEAIADRGYGAAENIQSLQEQKITSYIPLFSSRSGKIVELEEHGFIFDKDRNRYICPQGNFLLPKERGVGAVYKSKTEDCKNCPVSKDCAASLRQCSQHIRHIYRSHNQSFFEIEQQRIKTPEFIERMKERMWKVEGINAEAKNLHGLKRVKYRGLSKVQIQAYMTGAVQNLKRLIRATIIDILRSIYKIYLTKSLILSDVSIFTNFFRKLINTEILGYKIAIGTFSTARGDFEIANLPVITGKGDLVVKTQDITGVIRTITIPYYSSPSLLKAGLSDYSFETGVERKEFGLTSNKYDNFITSANYRYGINDYLTSEVHFESLKNYASIGTTHDIQLGNYGLITTSVASNIHNINNSQKGSLGYSYQESRYNFGATISKSGKKYSDVYSMLGQASSEPTYQTSAGYNNEKLGSIFVGLLSFVANNSNSESKRIKVLSTTYEKNITKSSSFRVTVGGNLANKRKESFAYLSFNANLGTKSIALSNSNQNGVSTKQFEYRVPVGKKLGWGYRASFIKGLTPDYDLQLDRKGEKGDVSLYLYRYGGAPVQQLEFTGGVVTMDGGFYRTQSIYNSLALVKAGGIKDVPVYSNNMLIGHTDEKGKMLVPDVLSYVPSEIRLNQNRLPLDTNFSSVSVKTAPKWRTGVMIDFEINTVRSVELVLLDNHKNALDLDKVVAIEGIKEALFVGYNGKLYITDINNLTDLKGKACGQGECCSFEVPVNIDSKDPILDLGEVICY